MKNKINWSIAIPVLLIVLALFLSNWLLQEKPTMQQGVRKAQPLSVEVATAELGQFPLTVKALGKVRARELVELQPQVTGRVEWLDYSFGTGATLLKNQSLLRIEKEPYLLALQSARGTLAERSAELQQEEGQRLVAEEEFELLGTSLPKADRSLVLREPQLAAARARVDSAKAQVNLAQRDLRLTNISAPFNALVVSRTVAVGDRVAPGFVMYTLAGADRFIIEVDVPARQLRQLNTPDAQVRIQGSQWQPGVYREGQFVRIIPVLEDQGRLAPVLVKLEDPLGIEDPSNPPLLLNDFARVEITGRAAGQQVRIPLTALKDGDLVWLVKQGKIEIQPVQISHFDGEFAILKSGLRGGETLVTTRLTGVTNDMPVRIASGSAKTPAVPSLNPELRKRKTERQNSPPKPKNTQPPELPNSSDESRKEGSDGERG